MCRKLVRALLPVYRPPACRLWHRVPEWLRILCRRPRRVVRDMDFHGGSDADSGDGRDRLHGYGAGAATPAGGHQVVAMDYKEGLQCDALRALGAEVVIGSVTDRAAVEAEHEGGRVRVPSRRGIPGAQRAQLVLRRGQRQGTRNVLEAAIKQGVWKFVYCSTCGVHGNVDHPPGGRGRPDPAGRLLPAHQVRGRAAGARHWRRARWRW